MPLAAQFVLTCYITTPTKLAHASVFSVERKTTTRVKRYWLIVLAVQRFDLMSKKDYFWQKRCEDILFGKFSNPQN